MRFSIGLRSLQDVGRLAAFLAIATPAFAVNAATHFVWFGTYTNQTIGSEGIYVSRFDDATGTLSAPGARGYRAATSVPAGNDTAQGSSQGPP